MTSNSSLSRVSAAEAGTVYKASLKLGGSEETRFRKKAISDDIFPRWLMAATTAPILVPPFPQCRVKMLMFSSTNKRRRNKWKNEDDLKVQDGLT